MLLKARTYGLPMLFVVCALLLISRTFTSQAGQVTLTLVIGGSKIDVTIESGEMKLSQAELIQWVKSAAEAVATYYGRYPVSYVQVRNIPVDVSGWRHGKPCGSQIGFILWAVSCFACASPDHSGGRLGRPAWADVRLRRWVNQDSRGEAGAGCRVAERLDVDA